MSVRRPAEGTRPGERVPAAPADGPPETAPFAGAPAHSSNGRRAILRSAGTRLRGWRGRASGATVRSLPSVARGLRALGVLVLLFLLFVVGFGAVRHTSRQSRLDEAFRVRVAGGHADGAGWSPLPGQAIATISIPAIGLREVVVQDTTPELLEDGPGHLLGTPLPGQVGNAVILGRRITDGAVFRDLGHLDVGAPITVVTPQGAFSYRVERVGHVAPDDAAVLGPSTDARLTLVTSGSWFFSRDRLVVTATLDGTPVEAIAPPAIQLRSAQLGGTGDTGAIVPLLPWAAVLLLGVALWFPLRRRIDSRRARFFLATPVLLVILFFLFENAANLLPGTI